VELDLPMKSDVQIMLRNLKGELIGQLFNAQLEKGFHNISLLEQYPQLQQLAPGAYVIMMSFNEKIESRILLKQ
jgi:hypothetical protein